MSEHDENEQRNEMTTNDSAPEALDAGAQRHDPADQAAGKVETYAPSPAPPKGPRVRRLAAVVLFGALFLWIGNSWGDALKRPFIKVWEAVSSSEPEPDEHSGTSAQYYTCGMHPWVILPKPGDCPICHMKLTPLDPSKFSGEITIDPVITQNIGVRVAPVVSGTLTRTIRTVGKVDYDETAVRDINTRVDGWMEKLYVDYIGSRVDAGQPLFEVFSRELYSAQEEYLIALRSSANDANPVGFVPEVGQDLKRNLEAARRRLLLFGITPEQIESLKRDGQVSQTMTITSPYEGLVTEKHAFEGMRVTPGMLAYRIADLSKVWVFVTLYEYQLPFVLEGQAAVMTLPYIPGQRFEGKVTYIYPWLQEKTREVRVRLEFPNPNMLLKPGMFATVELKGRLADERTLAPREAIIDTGEREVAFVSRGGGKFEPREVRMGVQSEDGMVEILEGLRPGEMVVTSGQFLLDSEAKIREALGKMIRGDMASEQERAAVVAGASELHSLPDGMASDLGELLNRYFDIGSRLAGDQLDGTATPARDIAAVVDRLLEEEIPGHEHFWHEHDEVARVRGKALELATATDLAGARLSFGDLSIALSKLIGATGVPPRYGKEVRELHCPMFREGQGGSTWLQPAGDVRNPFFGSVMLECFDRERSMPVTGQSAQTNKPPESSPPASDGRSAEARLPEGGRALDATLTAYLEVQRHLASDDAEGLIQGWSDLVGGAQQLASDGNPEMRAAAKRMLEATRPAPKEIEDARERFKVISAAASELLQHAIPSAEVAPTLYEAYCPMAKASWLQAGTSIMNPYYGASMLDCGSIRKTIRGTSDAEGDR